MFNLYPRWNLEPLTVAHLQLEYCKACCCTFYDTTDQKELSCLGHGGTHLTTPLPSLYEIAIYLEFRSIFGVRTGLFLPPLGKISTRR